MLNNPLPEPLANTTHQGPKPSRGVWQLKMEDIKAVELVENLEVAAVLGAFSVRDAIM